MSLLQAQLPASNGDAAEGHEAAASSAEAASAALQDAQPLGERLSDGGDSSRASCHSSIAEQDSAAGRRDSDLEAAVLDTLTDGVLTGVGKTGRSSLLLWFASRLSSSRVNVGWLVCAACSCTPPEIVEEFVAIVDGGTVRPLERSLPGSRASSRFPQLCLRKLYVLCSRGAEVSSPQGCLLQVTHRPQDTFSLMTCPVACPACSRPCNRGPLRQYTYMQKCVHYTLVTSIYSMPGPHS